MTGFEPDRHGIHSSSTATRNPDEKTWTNLLDFRPDTHFYVFGKESRLYKRLVETNVKPIQEYIDPKQVLIATIPVSCCRFDPGRCRVQESSHPVPATRIRYSRDRPAHRFGRWKLRQETNRDFTRPTSFRSDVVRQCRSLGARGQP